jgi:hypothetical protein
MTERQRTLELLSAWIDGELSAEERAEMERRLAREPDLRRELAALAALARVPLPEPPPPPADLAERIRRRRASARARTTRRWQRWLPAAAGLAAALVVGVLVRETWIGPGGPDLPVVAERSEVAARDTADEVVAEEPARPEPAPPAARAPEPVREPAPARQEETTGAAETKQRPARTAGPDAAADEAPAPAEKAPAAPESTEMFAATDALRLPPCTSTWPAPQPWKASAPDEERLARTLATIAGRHGGSASRRGERWQLVVPVAAWPAVRAELAGAGLAPPERPETPPADADCVRIEVVAETSPR